jgi:hypothetical protein
MAKSKVPRSSEPRPLGVPDAQAARDRMDHLASPPERPGRYQEIEGESQPFGALAGSMKGRNDIKAFPDGWKAGAQPGEREPRPLQAIERGGAAGGTDPAALPDVAVSSATGRTKK